MKKEHLTKKKNDEVHEESWVQCDKCDDGSIRFVLCLTRDRTRTNGQSSLVPSVRSRSERKRVLRRALRQRHMAEDLPRTKLSQRLENHVRKEGGRVF